MVSRIPWNSGPFDAVYYDEGLGYFWKFLPKINAYVYSNSDSHWVVSRIKKKQSHWIQHRFRTEDK